MRQSLMISARNLSKSFGPVQALRGVDLDAGAGSILGVLGPNGAGKTTAIRILTTLTSPDSGSAWVAGHDVVNDPASVRRVIGVTGQDATLDESLTGRQNLLLVGELSRLRRPDAKRRAAELLDLFALADAGDRVLKTYSGGMRRRLDLAASLVAKPPVLFLDEPTTGLDPTSRQRVWALIRGLVAEGTTVLLTTQYLDEADSLADRIVLFDHGRVVAEGTPAELKGSTGSQLVEVSLARPDPRAAEALRKLGMGSVNVSRGGRRLQVPARNEPGLAVTALRALDEVGAEVEDIAVHQPTLDDVFGILTGGVETPQPEEVLV